MCAAFSGTTIDHFLCASFFPSPLLVLQWTCAIQKLSKAVLPIVSMGKDGYTLINSWDYLNTVDTTRYSNQLEDYWPCAGGLSAVQVFGTQWHDPRNSVLTQWLLTVNIGAVSESGRKEGSS